MTYRIMAIYEINGADSDEADDKMRGLDKAAQRLGIGRGFVDMAGPVRDDESHSPGRSSGD